jgi:hypothetical protein
MSWKNKYNNKIINYNGHKFHSKKELIRYQELLLLQQAGKIKHLGLQPNFELQPSFEKNNVKHRAITYKADFIYYDIEKKKEIIEDVKGYLGIEVYRIKKKLFEYKFQELEIKEIK